MARPTPSYRLRSPLPSLLVSRATGDHAYIEVLDPSGDPEAPASGTYELVDASGSTLASGSVTFDGTTVVSPSIATGDITPDDTYRERWVLTMDDGSLVEGERDAIICRFPLSCSIGPQDILRMSPQLDPASASSISGSLDLDEFVDEAWVQISNRLIEAGNRPWLSTSPHALREVCMELVHALIYGRLSTANNTFFEHADRHRTAYEAAWKRVRLTYATPDTGAREADRRPAKRAVVWLGSGR